MDYGIDSGEIILQSAMFRSDFEDFEDVLELQFPMLKIILRDILKYNISIDEVYGELLERIKPYFLQKNIIS